MRSAQKIYLTEATIEKISKIKQTEQTQKRRNKEEAKE